MSIVFNPVADTYPNITIGTDELFPTFSVERNDEYAPDGSYLYSKFNINVEGYVVASGSPVVEGERQSSLHSAIKDKLDLGKFADTVGKGNLVITAKDGTVTRFQDARIVNINIPQQSEDSNGMHYSQCSIQFEASMIDGQGGENNLSSMSDEWQLRPSDGRFCFDDSDISTQAYKVYELTHTVSANAMMKYTSEGSLATDGDAWRQAAKWVESRLVNAPDVNFSSVQINNDESGPNFFPWKMSNGASSLLDLGSGPVPYKCYNLKRQPQVDMIAGSYSVSDSWVVALESARALHAVNVSVNYSEDSPATSVEVNGTIEGLDNARSPSENDKNLKFAGAEVEYNKIKDSDHWYALASKYYNAILGVDAPGTLRNTKLRNMVGYNRTSGTITFGVTYDDLEIKGGQGIISEEISVSHGNRKRDQKTVAIIPVLGRPEGPIFQYFNTNQERTQSINIDLVMHKDYRSSITIPRDRAETLVNLYKVTGGVILQANGWPENPAEATADSSLLIVNERKETWNPDTGVYNYTISFIYR